MVSASMSGSQAHTTQNLAVYGEIESDSPERPRYWGDAQKRPTKAVQSRPGPGPC